MSRISIGALDERITLQQAARSADGAGGAVLTWTTVADVWAWVRAAGGSEHQDADQLTARLMHEVWIRRRDSVHAEMRVLWRGRVLEIRAVLDAGPRAPYLKLTCEERLA